MSKYQDPQYLLSDQYQNSEKLNARIRLHNGFSTNHYGWFRWVFDHFNLGEDIHLLELGCGPGDLWLENIARIPSGWQITISDFSLGMVSKARGRLLGQGRPFNFGHINAQFIPFEDNFFDAVIANHCIYHFPDRPKAISEIQRVLKQNGVFYATTVGRGHLQEMTELVQAFEIPIEDAFDNYENPFNLENGADQLHPWFSNIEMHRYPDSFVITEAEPLVEYILSTARFSLGINHRSEFSKFIDSQMKANGGAITISKRSGILISQKV